MIEITVSDLIVTAVCCCVGWCLGSITKTKEFKPSTRDKGFYIGIITMVVFMLFYTI